MGLFKRLFRPAWMSMVEADAFEALAQVGDAETLQQIVAEAPLATVRVAAMEKLGDQDFYRSCLLTSDDPQVVACAVPHVDDVTTLEQALPHAPASARQVVLDRIHTLRHEALRAQLAVIPEVDDAERLVGLAATDPALDLPVLEEPESPTQRPPRTVEDELREAAVRRLAALGDDAALVAVIHRASDEQVVDLAASLVQDKLLLDALVGDASLATPSRRRVIAHVDNSDLLHALADVVDPIGAIPQAAMKRLSALPCTDGSDHTWELVGEDEDTPDEEHRFVYRAYRCATCGITKRTVTRVED